MLEHLLGDDVYVPPVWDHLPAPPPHVSKLDATAVLDAKIRTADLLESIQPDHDSKDPVYADTANAVFNALADPAASDEFKLQNVRMLQTPDAVKHLVAMLTAYEWNFVQEANRIRGYLVAQLMEETKNPNARIRLKAVELLGKITEVALFTDRVEVKTSDVSDEELTQRLRAKLAKAITADAVDAVPAVDAPAISTTYPQ